MHFDEFNEQVVKSLEECFSDCKVELKPVVKNNGIKLTGVYVFQEDSEVAPCIYSESYWDMYRQGEPFCDIMEKITDTLKEAIDDVPFDRPVFDREFIEKSVFLKLLNRERNTEYASEVLKKELGDLIVVFSLLIENSGDRILSTLLTEKMCEPFNLTADDLYETALNNTREFFPLHSQSLVELFRTKFSDELPESFYDDTPEALIISNTSFIDGAIVVLYPEFKEVLGEDFSGWIIPSSIHEVLAIEIGDYKDLSELIISVNENILREEEILSNHPYRLEDFNI